MWFLVTERLECFAAIIQLVSVNITGGDQWIRVLMAEAVPPQHFNYVLTDMHLPGVLKNHGSGSSTNVMISSLVNLVLEHSLTHLSTTWYSSHVEMMQFLISTVGNEVLTVYMI